MLGRRSRPGPATAGFLVLIAVSSGQVMRYGKPEQYVGPDFFQYWNFYTGPDPTHGTDAWSWNEKRKNMLIKISSLKQRYPHMFHYSHFYVHHTSRCDYSPICSNNNIKQRYPHAPCLGEWTEPRWTLCLSGRAGRTNCLMHQRCANPGGNLCRANFLKNKTPDKHQKLGRRSRERGRETHQKLVGAFKSNALFLPTIFGRIPNDRQT